MVDEGLYKDVSLPIPTYEEAISRPSSSQSLGPEYSSQDAERQGLLTQRDGQNRYRSPTVGSARSSFDLDGMASEIDSRSPSTEELRREMAQMDILEPEDQRRHLLTGHRFSKHITHISNRLSSLHLPQIPPWIPSWNRIRAQLPDVKPNWIILGRFFALLLVLFSAYLLVLSSVFRSGRGVPGTKWFEPDILENYIRDHSNTEEIRAHLQYFTSFTHVAGTEGGQAQTQYVETKFAESLEDVDMEEYEVYLNYPREEIGSRKVAIVEPGDMVWEAQLEEDQVYVDDRRKANAMAFHGYSKSGEARGPLIYINHGSHEDLQTLSQDGIEIQGAIVLVRRKKGQAPAYQIRAAEIAGAAGCLIFSDVAEGDVYPNGRQIPEDGVQQGSAALSAHLLGDPLSPGYASLPTEARRESRYGSRALTNIPSLPLAWRDGRKLLQALKGYGRDRADWANNRIPGIEVWSGDSSSPQVLLRNLLDDIERKPIVNVIGRIVGIEQPDKVITIGNHRDSWCFGAGEPNGGTAVLLDVIRVFGELKNAGWRPLRTIEFVSWYVSSFVL